MGLSRLIFRDNLVAVRLAGVGAALFLLSAVWLVGSELFRRVPVYGHFGEVLEDDGRWIALMAMLIVGVSLPLYHWSRVPVVLEGTALATFGLVGAIARIATRPPWAVGIERDHAGLGTVLWASWSVACPCRTHDLVGCVPFGIKLAHR